MSHPFSNVAIVGEYVTKQGRMLEGEDSLGLTLESIKGALNDAGITNYSWLINYVFCVK